MDLRILAAHHHHLQLPEGQQEIPSSKVIFEIFINWENLTSISKEIKPHRMGGGREWTEAESSVASILKTRSLLVKYRGVEVEVITVNSSSTSGTTVNKG